MGSADPRYAIWPNLAQMLISDLDYQHFSCPPSSNPENQAYCYAKGYSARPSRSPSALINALEFPLRDASEQLERSGAGGLDR